MDSFQKLLCEKAKYKRELMGKNFFPRVPVLLIDLSKQKESKILKDLIEAVDALNLATVVISEDGEGLKSSKNIHVMKPEEKKQAFYLADFAVIPENEIKTAWGFGCAPIAQMDGKLTVNYSPLQEKGNGFYFASPTKWEIFAGIVRAVETYQFPYDWENLVREMIKVN